MQHSYLEDRVQKQILENSTVDTVTTFKNIFNVVTLLIRGLNCVRWAIIFFLTVTGFSQLYHGLVPIACIVGIGSLLMFVIEIIVPLSIIFERMKEIVDLYETNIETDQHIAVWKMKKELTDNMK